MSNISKEVKNFLQGSGISVDDVRSDGHNKIFIDILWGDWKQDHLRLRHVMINHGFVFLDEEVTEEDGSDCYSATHSYRMVS